MNTLFDNHVHSISHGENQPFHIDESLTEVMRKGLESVCIVDHFPLPQGFVDPVATYHSSLPPEKYFGEYMEKVKAAQEKYKDTFGLYFGTEVDWITEYKDVITQELQKHQFDYILGTVRFVQDEKKNWWLINYSADMFNEARKSFGTIQGLIKVYYQNVRDLINSKLFHSISHFDVVKKFNNPDNPLFSEFEQWYKDEVLLTLDMIQKTNMILELNTSGFYQPCKDQYPSRWILEEARKRSIPLTIGSDAHGPAEVGQNIERAVEIAKTAGYSSLIHLHKA